MRFSVATNFRQDFVEAMEDFPVAELFGKLPSDCVGGGRASFMLAPLSRDRFKEHVRLAAQKGIGFNYLINPACMDNREYTRRGQAELEQLLGFVEDCGVTAVTVSLPFLLPIIQKRHPRLKVRIGVYARVDSLAKAKYWEEMGADCITLESISVNRDFPLLQAIRQGVRIDLQLIANSNCLLYCPLAGQHMVNLSHASQKRHESRGFLIDYCALTCSCDKLADPSHYLRSEFIRPEDLDTYIEMGFTDFKILERGAPTQLMAKRVRAYASGRYEGNLLDLIQPYGYREKTDAGLTGARNIGRFIKYFFRPAVIKTSGMLKLKKLAEKRGLTAPLIGDPVRIDNRQLDGFLSGMRQIECRTTDCSRCGYCAEWARRAITIDGQYRAEMMKLYFDIFGEMYSGALWGLDHRRANA